MIAVVEGPGQGCEPFAAARRVDAPEPVPAGPGPKKRGSGPKTVAGKERSRQNATKEGLFARHVFPDALQRLIDRRTVEFTRQFRPQTEYETTLVVEMAVGKAKVDRCLQLQMIDDDQIIFRADRCWDQDMDEHVEGLAARLRRDPARVAKALGGSVQGNRWLIERWRGLGQCVKANGGWTEDQRQLAFDMLGVPQELRDHTYPVPPGTDAPKLVRLVVKHLKRLRARRASLAEIDDAARDMSLVGIPWFEFPTTARLRKAVTTARREWHWAHRELLRVRGESEQDQDQDSAPAPVPVPVPVPEAASTPSRSSSASSPRSGTMPAPELSAMPILSNAARTYLTERRGDSLSPDGKTETETEPVMDTNMAPGGSAAAVPARATAASTTSAGTPATAAAVPPPSTPRAREYAPMSTPLVPRTEPRNRRERRAQEARARKSGATAGQKG